MMQQTSEPATATVEDASTVERLMATRYSCRAYLPDQVPRPVVERILATAQRTASWCNSQAWQLVVLGGDETDRLRADLLAQADTAPERPDIPFPARYEGIYRQRRRDCGWALYESVGIVKGDRAASAAQGRRNFEFFGAPHVAVVTTPSDLGSYGAVDCGAFVSSFLLSAHSHGVASIAQAAPAAHSGFLRERLGMADDRWVVCAISFGYAHESHPVNSFRTTRAGVDEAVEWVGW